MVSDGRYPCGGSQKCSHQGHMPSTTALLAHPSAAKAFRYIADAPTTTTQRLKSMVSGSLPTFFDISNAFTARPMDEDNLIHQMSTANWSLVFMGDATWVNLFPTQFNTSLPFPCFNVKDLDTVDDGIWTHLLPTLRRPATWDTLVAHYLGVDHAGHAHGVDSPRMVQKLRQMDEHIAAVVEELAAGGGAGGAFEDTLLVISGDHGQTLGGDHGGGSPEEVDSVLIAVDIAALRREKDKKKAGRKDRDVVMGWVSECRAQCTCGDDKNQCADDLAQIDLVPTLSAMLGLPVPFGNLGKMSPELWSLAAQRCRSSDKETAEHALARATAANAEQVHTYLNTYALHKTARFPATALKRLNEMFESLPRPDASTCGGGTHSIVDSAQDCGASAHLEFLKEAMDVAKVVWTQFDDVSMAVGLIAFLAAVLLHGVLAWRELCTVTATVTTGHSWWQDRSWRDVAAVFTLWLGVVLHCGGIFSFFYLLSEGKSVGVILIAVTVILAVLQITAPDQTGPFSRRKILTLAVIAVVCICASHAWGLASHSGYGFWQRLTVHDVDDPTGEVPCGGGGKGVISMLLDKFDSSNVYYVIVKHMVVYACPTMLMLELVQPPRSGGNAQMRVRRSVVFKEYEGKVIIVISI